MKTVAIAHLRNVPTVPRRMRQVADLIRGEEVEKALGILRFSTRHSSRDLEKFLLSAISNWQAKNEGAACRRGRPGGEEHPSERGPRPEAHASCSTRSCLPHEEA